MNIVILAAGSGTRLRPYTDELPKTLVPMGKKPMLQYILDALKSFEVDKIVVVTGYRREALEEYLRDMPKVQLVYNDRFDTLNNFYSLLVALDHLKGDDFIKIDGDLVFEPRLLNILLDAEGDIRIATDTSKRLGAEEMKIEVDSRGRLVRFSKEIDPAAALGESIGMEYISADSIEPLRLALQRLYDSGHHDAYYEEAYGILGSEGHDVRPVPVPENLRWIEVDDHNDLRKGVEIFEGTR